MRAQRNVVKLCLSLGKAAQNPLPSDLLGKNLCKTANMKQADLAEKPKKLSVASHTVVCEFAWTRHDLFPGYYLFHVVCSGCR